MDLNETHLEEYMSKFGHVTSCKILKKNGHSRGFGFVTFEAPEVAQYVITQTHVIEGKEVSIKLNNSKSLTS